MEKERTSVPPGIGPKLPEPRLDIKRIRPTRRETAGLAVAVLLLVALATWFIVFALGSAHTPKQAIDRQVGDDTFKVQQEVIQLSVPGAGERSIYFYISSDALSCALLERRAGGYTMVDTWGHLALTAPGEQGAWIAGGLQGSKQEYIIYGILYEENLRAVEVDGQPAVLADNGQYRCWYYLGEGALSINPKSIVYR